MNTTGTGTPADEWGRSRSELGDVVHSADGLRRAAARGSGMSTRIPQAASVGTRRWRWEETEAGPASLVVAVSTWAVAVWQPRPAMWSAWWGALEWNESGDRAVHRRAQAG
ncbi:hypothetical protein ColTof3_12528 [Colletotrichum tofieldiae]|nr:hypothetical protein ColTof3_12528 [Colletotrichum tofieldiae]